MKSKWVLIFLTVAYILSPVDLAPGPADDALVTIVSIFLTKLKEDREKKQETD